jgi:hypothetical protein
MSYSGYVTLLRALVMAGFLMPEARKRAAVLSKVNLEEEYKLIQKKKSNLSANERRIIVDEYERREG